MEEQNHSRELFARARKTIPGGVNSPVRAFGAVGLEPLFIKRAEGSTVWDEDGRSYIDYVASWGPMILGHADPHLLEVVGQAARNGLSFGAPCRLEVELAETVTRLTGVEMVRMVNSGTEAVMSALRVARGVTGQDKIIKFAGCYHGHSDCMLVNAGSGALTSGVPSSAGVPAGAAADTLTATYNDLNSVEQLFQSNKGAVSAVIVEPVAANMGVIPPAQGFLEGLRSLCDQYGALLIFDEVITGFRLGTGGAQAYFDVKADLVTYGKIIGGGLPVGAYGGKRSLMEQVAPSGPIYQAGTLSGNPVAMAAGLYQLEQLERTAGEIYPRIAALAADLAAGLQEIAHEYNIPLWVNVAGSLCCGFFTQGPVTGYAGALQSDTKRYAAFFSAMLEQGIYLAPSQFEAMFIGACHTRQQVEQTLEAAKKALRNI